MPIINFLMDKKKPQLRGFFTAFQIVLSVADIHSYFKAETHIWIFWFSPHSHSPSFFDRLGTNNWMRALANLLG